MTGNLRESKSVQEATGCGHLYCHFHKNGKGVQHVEFNLGKSGSCPFAFLKAISGLMNKCLEMGVTLNDLIPLFDNIHCSKTIRRGEFGKTYSCIDAIGKAIEEYLTL